MDIDLTRLAERLTKAAKQAEGLKVTASSTDLIFSKTGFGTGKSESVPFAALFLRNDDAVAQALHRLNAGGPDAPIS